MKTLLINFKNYPEAIGEGAVRLASAAEKVADGVRVEMIVAPPNSMLALVASKVSIPVFSQSVQLATSPASTGADVPEAVAAANVAGSLLNHSEARLGRAAVEELVVRLHGLGLRVCLCSRNVRESVALSRYGTEYVAVEPPELIGSGRAVSRVKPEVVTNTVKAVREAGYAGKVLCGAGIVDGNDASKAVELGADGVLVSSSVVKAEGWVSKIDELARSLE